MHASLTHTVTAATTPFDPCTAVNDSSSCGNDYRQGGDVWSESLFLSLISVFNPSISYRGVQTGNSHCGPAGLQTLGQSLQSCSPMLGSKRALFTPLPVLESTPSVRLQCSCSPACLPASSAGLSLPLLHAILCVCAPPSPPPTPQLNTTTKVHSCAYASIIDHVWAHDLCGPVYTWTTGGSSGS